MSICLKLLLLMSFVGVLHVKLSKAFDTLSHSSLLEKLKSFGIKVSDDSHT